MTAVLIYTAKVRIPEFAILDPCLRVSDVGGTVLPQKHSTDFWKSVHHGYDIFP